jgi:hypothetical protein
MACEPESLPPQILDAKGYGMTMYGNATSLRVSPESS